MSSIKRHKTRFKLDEIEILDADEKQLIRISRKLGIGLNLKEMKAIQNYFSKRGRNPTDIELQTLGQTWSEHCFHKTFKGNVMTEQGKIQNLFKTYISKVTREVNPSWCISVFEDNAGIIEFNEDYAIAAKVETHNHPSAIEPFGGAATGVGGVIRDILGVWADPIACTDVLGFGPLDYDYRKLPQGVKHPKFILRGVVAGIGCYGNNMGIPTVNGAIYFDESYVGNVVVFCGCVGLLPKDKFVKDAKSGDIILLAGGRTGRDGIHGVTFASAELTEESEQVSRSAVQIANPIQEEKLKRAIVAVRDRKLGSAITDLGGGGLSSAIGEMAHRFGCGAFVELDKVSLKYKGLSPWEIYVSESQERMLLLVPRENAEEVMEIFKAEDVEAGPIGEFTDENTLKISYEDYEVANLDIDFLFAPPKTENIAKWDKSSVTPSFSEPHNLGSYVLKLLASANIRSREGTIRTYDHEVQGNTVLKPLHGEFAGPSDAAVLKPLEDSWKGIVVSCGMNPSYGKIDPYWMAAAAIDEAVRNNTAVGGRRIALLDNFVWGSPEKPDRLGGLIRACKACYEIAKGFEIPFISGKDSLYNESPLGPITPTLLMTAIGVIPDVKQAVSLDLKTSGDPIYLVGQTFAELGGSEYYRLKGFIGSSVPKVRLPQAKHVMKVVIDAVDSGCVKACHDLSEGGLAVSAAEMALAGEFGLEIWMNKVPTATGISRNDFVLFAESNSRFLLEISKKRVDEFHALLKNVPHAVIGEVTRDPQFRVYGLDNDELINIEVSELRKSWKHSSREFT